MASQESEIAVLVLDCSPTIWTWTELQESVYMVELEACSSRMQSQSFHDESTIQLHRMDNISVTLQDGR